MQEVFKFIVEYWREILSVGSLVVSFIILVCRKKPITDIVSDIYELCILAINAVERQGRSSDKLEKATSYVIQDLKLKYPNIKVGCYENLIKKVIENILTTPQKK